MKKILILFLLCITSVFAAQDYYSFSYPVQHERFTNLTSQLRCLVCQNQNLSESNAPLAVDLREQIYQSIVQGKSDEEIVNYLVSRYGNYILYRPPLDLATAGLWVIPFLLLISGLGGLFYYIRKGIKSC